MPTKEFQQDLTPIIQRVTFPFTTLAGEIALNEYFEKLYLAPEISFVKPDYSFKLEKQVIVPEVKGKRLVLTGAMGTGKSTYLLWLYMDYLKRYEDDKFDQKPFIFSLPQYLDDSKLREFIAANRYEMIFFIDSLDETVGTYGEKELYEALDLFLSFPSMIIACRSPFFNKLFSAHRRLLIDEVAEIEILTKNRQQKLVARYLNSSFLKKIGYAKKAVDKANKTIGKCRKQNGAESTITATPLFSALCAIVAIEDPSSNELVGVIDVYGRFLEDVIKRSFADGPETEEKLLKFAFALNSAYQNKEKIYLHEVVGEYGDSFAEGIKILLQIKNMQGGKELVIDFSHRSIGEYLFARYIISKLIDPDLTESTILSVLDTLMNYEVSFFIRSMFDDLGLTGKKEVNGKLMTYVSENLATKDEKGILAVHNCMYFSRFLVDNWKPHAQELSDTIFAQKDQIHPLILGTYLSGVIASEAIQVQERFLPDGAVEKSPLVNRNLNYYLFYYGDSEYAGTNDFVKDISSGTSWDNTRSVLLKRLRDTSYKKRLFRCHDLTILRQFLSRTGPKVSKIDIEAIREIVADKDNLVLDCQSAKMLQAILDDIDTIKTLIGPAELVDEKDRIISKETPLKAIIISISPNWGFEEGGVNVVNFDLMMALARYSMDKSTFKIVCITNNDPRHHLAKVFEESGGELISLRKSDFEFKPKDIAKIRSKIDAFPSASNLVFIGHDVLTGGTANFLAHDQYAKQSISAIIHHMDYQSYQMIKGEKDLYKNNEKYLDQIEVLNSADIVFAIGPKLLISAKRIINNNVAEAHQLIPGIPKIEPKSEKSNLVLIVFGRYDKKTDNLKQIKLAATSFTNYVEKNRDEAGPDATLKIIGFNTEAEAEELVQSYSHRAAGFINILPLPYNNDREKLFAGIAASSIGMMLSVHEGFGLVGLEIIAAGVPLILSKNTGLYQFIIDKIEITNFREIGIFPVDVKGSQDGSINPQDEASVVHAISTVWSEWEIYKKGVLTLRSLLLEKYSWQQACETFINDIEKYIQSKEQ